MAIGAILKSKMQFFTSDQKKYEMKLKIEKSLAS